MQKILLFSIGFILSTSLFGQYVNKGFTYSTGITPEHFGANSMSLSDHLPKLIHFSTSRSSMYITQNPGFHFPAFALASAGKDFHFDFHSDQREVIHQPLFCRIESQIERKSRLAPRFRLGSLDYTDWLEGKCLQRE